MGNSHGDHATSLAEARSQLRDICLPHERTESVPITESDGRILAETVEAVRTVPHYDRAAMDGFAVRASDLTGASEHSPVRLELVEVPIGEREATRVHTGSAFPEGADAVVRVERTDVRENEVIVYDGPPAGKDVAPAGEDVDTGDLLFDAGHRLHPADVALLRATGHRRIDIIEHPRVSVIPTGEELVQPGTDPEPGEVVETNGLLVNRFVERWGGKATYRDVVGDDVAALRDAISGDTDHDLIATTGGTSVGARDRIDEVVTDIGEVLVDGVAIKPGHPVGVGVVDGTPLVLLPGYPVSCLVTAVQFLRPAIAWRADEIPQPYPTIRGETTEPLGSKPGKRSFKRVGVDGWPPDEELERSEDRGRTELPAVGAVRKSGASVLSGVTIADGWVEIPESRDAIPAGEEVSVQRWT
jgi:molybdopterin molybdotransferase